MKISSTPSVLYSEEYILTYWLKREDGYVEQRSVKYYSTVKNAHSKIEKVFLREFPKVKKEDIVCVEYQ